VVVGPLKKKERGCLVHFSHLANTLLKGEESATTFLIVTDPSSNAPIG